MFPEDPGPGRRRGPRVPCHHPLSPGSEGVLGDVAPFTQVCGFCAVTQPLCGRVSAGAAAWDREDRLEGTGRRVGDRRPLRSCGERGERPRRRAVDGIEDLLGTDVGRGGGRGARSVRLWRTQERPHWRRKAGFKVAVGMG